MQVVTDADRQKVKEYLREAVKATERKAEEQAQINDIIKVLKMDHDIEPKLARKMISVMRKGNYPELKEENDQFHDLAMIVL